MLYLTIIDNDRNIKKYLLIIKSDDYSTEFYFEASYDSQYDQITEIIMNKESDKYTRK